MIKNLKQEYFTNSESCISDIILIQYKYNVSRKNLAFCEWDNTSFVIGIHRNDNPVRGYCLLVVNFLLDSYFVHVHVMK